MTSGLLDSRGNPFKRSDHKKASPPKLGEQFGNWAGDNVGIFNMPGAGTLTFDLDRLTMSDFRQMLDHYQINSSLSILTFMMHQTEWHVECEKSKIADECEEQLTDVWSRLVRAMSQSFWAGYSPNVLQWENDVAGEKIVLAKIKDLIPEDCRVHWDMVEGSADRFGHKEKFPVYGGIDQIGSTKTIPVDNSFWYPLLMQNGDYYGKKLLRSAFQPWFFSILVHLFANRYYERFGEPVPLGRAPYEDEVDIDGKAIKGNKLMEILLTSLRNRSVAVLPSERTPVGDERQPPFDYSIEYLESQMRGADFERYLTRLDEEMSLALFTPILLMRTADVGSYNLGVGHTQVYLWMLNAITGDWANYINKYILSPIANWNFGINAPRPKIKFVKMGKVNSELLRTVVSETMKAGIGGPDIRELSELTGMTFKEFQIVTGEDTGDDTTGQPDDTADADGPLGGDSPRNTAKSAANRLASQVRKAYRSGFNGDFTPELGYKKRFVIALRQSGNSDPERTADDYYSKMELVARNLASSHGDISDPEMFMRIYNKFSDTELQKLAA